MGAAAAAAAPIRSLGRARLVAALVALVAAAWVATALLGAEPAGDGVTTVRAAGGTFALDHPPGWRAAAPAELAATRSRPAALLRRDDRRGVVIVRERPPLRESLAEVGRRLPGQLARRMPDLRPVATRFVRLATGPALAFTFVRERSGQVQSIVVAPTGDRTLTLESIARGDAADVAREAGAIVRSVRR